MGFVIQAWLQERGLGKYAEVMEKEGFVEIDELEEMAQEVRQPHLLCSKLAHQPSRAMQLAVNGLQWLLVHA